MPIPKWRYTFTKAPPFERIEWLRAMLLGIELQSLEIDGRPVTPQQLFLLNLWISAWGAWRASRQDYFEAWRRIDTILTTKAKPCRRKGRRHPKGDQVDP